MNINTNISSIGLQLVQSGSGTSQTIPQASSAELGGDSTSGDDPNPVMNEKPAITQAPPPAGMGQIVDKTV
jgi:hypothetical protein